MVQTKPIKIAGVWREGYALDLHTVHSKLVSHDEVGKPTFDTQYTEMGKLCHDLKYHENRAVISRIAEAVDAFIGQWKIHFDGMIPVPPSKDRYFQPVMAVALELSTRYGHPLWQDCLIKVRSTDELKEVEDPRERARILRGAFTVKEAIVAGDSVLLFDDLFRSGSTLSEITRVLYEKGKAADVFVLALTKTRSKR